MADGRQRWVRRQQRRRRIAGRHRPALVHARAVQGLPAEARLARGAPRRQLRRLHRLPRAEQQQPAVGLATGREPRIRGADRRHRVQSRHAKAARPDARDRRHLRARAGDEAGLASGGRMEHVRNREEGRHHHRDSQWRAGDPVQGRPVAAAGGAHRIAEPPPWLAGAIPERLDQVAVAEATREAQMGSLDDSERQLDPTLLAGAATAREQERTPVEGTALCLSGGGYRAMVFHLGALWRLNDLGMLRGLARVSSVSGGSITAGVLGSRWRELDFDRATSVGRAFAEKVAGPIHELASTTIDIGAVVTGALLPGTRDGGAGSKAARSRSFSYRRSNIACRRPMVSAGRTCSPGNSCSRPRKGSHSISARCCTPPSRRPTRSSPTRSKQGGVIPMTIGATWVLGRRFDLRAQFTVAKLLASDVSVPEDIYTLGFYASLRP